MFMKKILFLLSSFFAALVFVACSESSASDSYLTIDPNTLNFSAEGGITTFNIMSNTSWSISMDNSNVAVSPMSGSGDQTVQVKVSESRDIQQKETKLMIKTGDGAIVRNLNVIQEGYLLVGGTLEVTNHSNILTFNGVAKDIDSLAILSNAPWELKGPEWIEAYNGSRWVALSPTRAMISGNATTETSQSRTSKLYIRTASINSDEIDRNDILTLSQPYSGDLKVQINVWQLGRHHAASNVYVPLATGIATDWKCGCDVKTIYARLFTSELSNSQLEAELVGDNAKKWLPSSPDAVAYWTGLNESSSYFLYTVGVDANNSYTNIHGLQIYTGSSKNQAIASFKNVNYDGKKWSWQIDMNEYCKGFFEWAMIEQESFYYSDELLAWFFSYRLHDDELTKEHVMWTSFEYAEIEYNSHIQLITWGIGQDGTKMAGVLSRYRSIDHYKTRSEENFAGVPIAQSVPKDIKAFEKALIRIK